MMPTLLYAQEKEPENPATAYANLYLIGNVEGVGWDNTSNAIESERETIAETNYYVFKNVTLSGINEWNIAYFRFLTAKDYSAPQYAPANQNSDLDLYFKTPSKNGKVKWYPNDVSTNFVVSNGTYDIYVDLDTHSIRAEPTDETVASKIKSDSHSLWLVGYPNWDTCTELKYDVNNPGVYTFQAEVSTESSFQLLYDNWDWNAIRLIPQGYGSKSLNDNGLSVSASWYVPLGGEGSFTIKPEIEGGTTDYKITVDLNKMTVTAKPVFDPKEVKNLFLIGDANNVGWWPINSATRAVKEGNSNKYIWTNVIFNKDGDDWSNVTNDFQITINYRNYNDRFCPNTYYTAENGVNYDVNLNDNNNTANLHWLVNDTDVGFSNYQVYNGVYDIVADLDAGTVTITPVESFMPGPATFRMSFWEGPINDVLSKTEDEASDITFKYYGQGTVPERTLYKIEVVKPEEPIDEIKYASQMWIGGQCGDVTITYDPETKRFTREGNSTFETFYFDAHSTGTLVPLLYGKDKFWCDNSRMEVGMTVRAIYLVHDSRRAYNPETGASPYYILLSSDEDGKPNLDAVEQIPFNSHSYSITLSRGALYEALKGTRTGTIEVPFVRHHNADEGYVINLGSYITTDQLERFGFKVNGQTYTGGRFTLNKVNELVDGSNSAANNSIASELKFNKIILIVSDDPLTAEHYDKYQMFLSGEQGEGEDPQVPAKFEAYAYNSDGSLRNPKLKVWTNNNASWESLYNSNIEPLAVDGTVKYYDFVPVLGGENSKTNVYYLDLSDANVVIHRAKNVEGAENNHTDQFNIVSNDGYDISTPFQGSQYIFPDRWWCCNPNLLDETYGTRVYKGKKFKKVPNHPSSVDLAWNISSGDEKEEVRIYGITLFKIMGSGYDVYADAVRERPLYYIYASTVDPNTTVNKAADATEGHAGANDLPYEKTAPILLELKNADVDANGNSVSTMDDFMAQYPTTTIPLIYTTDNSLTVYDKYRTDDLGDLDPNPEQSWLNKGDAEKEHLTHYVLTQSSKILSTNDDLNYKLSESDIYFTPGSANTFEFVDVTGTNRWSAPGNEDKLRPNTWSNYYTADDENTSDILVEKKNALYFKIALATNPDQVRYQIMSYELSMVANNSLDYKPADEDSSTNNNGEAHILIYPKTELEASLIWRDKSVICVTLSFFDKGGNKVGEVEKWITKGEAQDGQTSNNEEGFFKDDEFSFEVNLGEYFTNPEWTVKATANYYPDLDGNGEADNYEAVYPTESDELSTGDFEKPGIDKLTASNPLKGDGDTNQFYADLSWVNTESDTNPGLPRDYEIHSYEKTGDDNSVPTDETGATVAGTKVDHANVKAVEDSETETNYQHGQVATTTENSTGNDNTVYVGYRVGANYHYAVPTEPKPSETLNDYTLSGLNSEFFTHVTVPSHEEVNDRPYTEVDFSNNTTTGIEDILEGEADAETEIFNLSGVRVCGTPAPGIYLVRKGNTVTKTLIK